MEEYEENCLSNNIFIQFYKQAGILKAYIPAMYDFLPTHEELDAIIAAAKEEKKAHTKEEIAKRNEYLIDSHSDPNFIEDLEFEKTFRSKSYFLEKTPTPRKKEHGHIYLLKSNGLYKVGKTKNPKDRMKTYRTENPFGIEIVHQVEVDDYTQVEKELIEMFSDKLKLGKEWFELVEEDIFLIKDFLESKAFILIKE